MVTHRIRAREPTYINADYILDDNGTLDRVNPTEDGPVPGIEDDAQYECTCGIDFGNDLQAAERHLEDIAASDSGEAVSSRATVFRIACSIETRHDDSDRKGVSLEIEVPTDVAARMFVMGYQSNRQCSNQLAWAAFYGLLDAWRSNNDTAEFTVHSADRGWQGHLSQLFDDQSRHASGEHGAILSAVADEIRAV